MSIGVFPPYSKDNIYSTELPYSTEQQWATLSVTMDIAHKLATHTVPPKIRVSEYT